MNIPFSKILIILLCLVSILVSGCTNIDISGNQTTQTSSTVFTHATPDTNQSSWITIPVTDVLTGEENSIVDLAEKERPLIIHTFAVWCPACSLQLRETTKLIRDKPGAYSVLAIDIDPREDHSLVKNHIEKNQFSGIFVVSPPEMTRSLIETLGSQIVGSLPQTIVVCNKSVVYIGDGVFREERLSTIIPEICNQFGKN